MPILRNEKLPEDLVERLQYIELFTSRAVKSALLGDYKSRTRGQGFNFDQHKKYQEGDDFRQIDWNVFARLQEVFVKKNLEDKQLAVVVVADLSRSMELVTNALSKKEVLFELTAALTFSAVADQIGAGLLVFADKIEEYIAPAKGRRQVWKILERLWNLSPGTVETNLGLPLEFLHTRLKKSSLIFYLSDFVGRKNLFHSPYLRMVTKKHDLVPVVIEDQLESIFPSTRGFVRIRDLESNKEVTVRTSPKKQEIYNQQMQQRRAELQSAFYRLGLDHIWIRSDRPYINTLLQFFLNRKRRR